jgi:two-component SAPR family response regulator
MDQGLSKEQIGLVFWPDSSPGKLTCQIRNAFYKLRQVMGKGSIQYDSFYRNYSFNRSIKYQYDVETFRKSISDGNKENNIRLKIDHYQKAIKTYKHPYLPDFDSIWTEPIRRELFLMFEKAIIFVAREYLGNGDFQFCIDICNQIINIDPCHEEAYQLSMQSAANLGDRSELQKNYEDYLRHSKNMGIQPSRRIIDMFNNLY